MRRSLNLNWIRSFEASARLLSFTKAAQELTLTQAGVSQHIRMLEEQLGERLFTRLPRAVRLTDAGEAYLRVVRESLDRLKFGTSDIFGPGEEGRVRLRVDPGFAAYWLAPRLGGFLAEFPDIALHVSPTIGGVDTDWDEYDLEISQERDRAAGVDAIVLVGDTIFPVCGPALAAALHKPEDILHQRLLHQPGDGENWAEWFRLSGITTRPATPLIEVESLPTALAFAEQGLGVTLAHASLVASLLETGRLVRPFPSPLEIIGIFYLIMPAAHPLRRQARLFRDWILALETTEADPPPAA
ncbi:LysR substrate-binding domain-containing protein [Acidisoma sp. 7E03]